MKRSQVAKNRHIPEQTRSGRVVATKGRRVVVRCEGKDIVCYLSGLRAVVGDSVLFVNVRGEGGKLVKVLERTTHLARVDSQGRERVLAANLGGLAVVMAAQNPPFRAGLIDRYAVAAGRFSLQLCLVLNKIDEGIPQSVLDELKLRESWLTVHFVSATTGEGVDSLSEELVKQGPWALVGHSGVGKTSLVATWLPEMDVGAVGELSEYWGTGQHTTTGSKVFELASGAEVMDSPGIRTFAPAGLTPENVRDFFPLIGRLPCKFRNCLHRISEQGCVIDEHVQPAIITSYRRLLSEVDGIYQRQRRW